MCYEEFCLRNKVIRKKMKGLISLLRLTATPKLISQYFDCKSDAELVRDSFSLFRRKTLALMSHDAATIADLEKLEWFDTTKPGVYFCICYYTDGNGEKLSYLYIGCAWSKGGGLNARKRGHLHNFRYESRSFVCNILLNQTETEKVSCTIWNAKLKVVEQRSSIIGVYSL